MSPQHDPFPPPRGGVLKIYTLFQAKLFQKTNIPPAAARTCIAYVGEYSPLPPRGSITIPVNDVCFSIFRYQDTHNQSFIMVVASGRWLGVRLDLLCELFIGAVAVMAILLSQDAGM